MRELALQVALLVVSGCGEQPVHYRASKLLVTSDGGFVATGYWGQNVAYEDPGSCTDNGGLIQQCQGGGGTAYFFDEYEYVIRFDANLRRQWKQQPFFNNKDDDVASIVEPGPGLVFSGNLTGEQTAALVAVGFNGAGMLSSQDVHAYLYPEFRYIRPVELDQKGQSFFVPGPPIVSRLNADGSVRFIYGTLNSTSNEGGMSNGVGWLTLAFDGSVTNDFGVFPVEGTVNAVRDLANGDFVVGMRTANGSTIARITAANRDPIFGDASPVVVWRQPVSGTVHDLQVSNVDESVLVETSGSSLLIRLSPNGAELSRHEYAGVAARQLVQGGDSNTIVADTSDGFMLVRLASDDSELWRRSYRGRRADVQVTLDGGYAVSMNSNPDTDPPRLLLLDSSGVQRAAVAVER
jgi:hypothetical protein